MNLFPVLFALACLAPNFPGIEVRSGDSPRTIGLICKHFCSDASYSYDLTDFYDYFDYWRNIDVEDKPKIFCKLCKKKMGATTSSTVGPSTTLATTGTSTRSTTDKSTGTTPTTSVSTTTVSTTTTTNETVLIF